MPYISNIIILQYIARFALHYIQLSYIGKWVGMDDGDLIEYNRNIKMNEMGEENFYEKLMILKKEQAEHIKLVERVYFKELKQNNTLPANVRYRSILKKSNYNKDMVS